MNWVFFIKYQIKTELAIRYPFFNFLPCSILKPNSDKTNNKNNFLISVFFKPEAMCSHIYIWCTLQLGVLHEAETQLYFLILHWLFWCFKNMSQIDSNYFVNIYLLNPRFYHSGVYLSLYIWWLLNSYLSLFNILFHRTFFPANWESFSPDYCARV